MNPANTPRRTTLSVSQVEQQRSAVEPKPCGGCESCRWGQPELCPWQPGLITDFSEMQPGKRYTRLASGLYREVTD